METASVYEIDRARRTVLRQFSTGGNWTKVLALSPDEKTLFAANWVSDDVSEIDLASGTVRRRIKTVDTPRGLVVTADGRSLFVAGFRDGEIQRIDLVTGTGETLLRTGGAMRHMVADATGRVFADDMGTDQAFVVDATTRKVSRLAATDSHPNTIDVSPDGRLLFVSNRGQNGSSYTQPGPEWGSVLVVDTSTGVLLDAVVAGNQTTGLDVSPDGRLLAFTDFMDNRLSVYEIPPTEVLLGGGGGRGAVYRTELVKRPKAR
jgi:YVTN family beta-propeller protein